MRPQGYLLPPAYSSPVGNKLNIPASNNYWNQNGRITD